MDLHDLYRPISEDKLPLRGYSLKLSIATWLATSPRIAFKYRSLNMDHDSYRPWKLIRTDLRASTCMYSCPHHNLALLHLSGGSITFQSMQGRAEHVEAKAYHTFSSCLMRRQASD